MMTNDLEDMQSIIVEIGRHCNDLGQCVDDELAAIRGFLEGPLRIAVIGDSGVGKVEVISDLKNLLGADVDIADWELRNLPDTFLWDMAVLVTTADQPMSHLEVECIKEQRHRRRHSIVVVGRIDQFEAGSVREAIIKEIEDFVLRRKLTSINVEWVFHGLELGPPCLGPIVERFLGIDSIHHKMVGADLLCRVIDRVLGQVESRLTQRSSDYEKLAILEKESSRLSTRLIEDGRVVELGARDQIRSQYDRLIVSLESTAVAAVAWTLGKGRGDWEDVVSPISDAWHSFNDIISGVLTDSQKRFRCHTLEVMTKIGTYSSELEIPASPPLKHSMIWQCRDVQEQIEKISATKMNPMLSTVHEMCVAAIQKSNKDDKFDEHLRYKPVKEAKIRGKEPNEKTDKGKNTSEYDGKSMLREFGEITRKIAISSTSGRKSLDDEMRRILHLNLSATLEEKTNRLLDLVTEAVHSNLKKDIEAFMDWRSQELVRARQEIEDRHRWSAAHGFLKELRLKLRQEFF